MVSSDHAVQKNVWLSSWVLSVALLGDALLYIVLPINADAFGVSIATVGFLLAVNRIIRTFTYNLVVNFGQAVGPKRLAVIAASTAALSTFGYAVFEGVFLLSLSRVIWGLSYAGLLILTLHFASLNSVKTGTRIGLSRSVEQVGPLIAMLVGAWLVASVGPRDIFLYMGLASVLGIVLALFLVDIKAARNLQNKPEKNFSIPLPKPIDTLIFWTGFGIDGVFTVTIVLMWAEVEGPQTAMFLGALILAIRRLSEMVLGPMSGQISDRFGNGLPLTVMLTLCATGFLLIGFGALLMGCVLLVLCRGALGTLFPAAASKLYPEQRISSLTRNQTWRDIGAAAGPFLTGLLLSLLSPEEIHLITLACFLIALGWFFFSGDLRRLFASGSTVPNL
jgi:MFS family permease